MENNNNNIQQQLYQQQRSNKKYFAVIIILLLVIGLSVGYALLSEQFQINGSTIINGDAQWDISLKSSNIQESISCNSKCTFTNAEGAGDLVPDDGQGEGAKGAIIWTSGNNVYFKNYLAQPGTSFSFTVAYKNKGTMDAAISNVQLTPFTTPASTYLEYSVKYGAGTVDKDNNPLYAENTAVTQGQDLPAGATAVFKVTVTYKAISSTSDLPGNEAVATINASGGSQTLFTVTYEQKTA